MKDYDDKDLVIVAVFLICMAIVILNYSDGQALIGNALSGLFGIAVGRKMQ
jgi:hypothetical protein